MEFRLLGPVELWVHGRQIDLGPTKNKLMLAVLLMEAGTTVSVDALVRRVWGENPPPKVAGSVQAGVSRLRRRLEMTGDAGVRLDHASIVGYRLTVPAHSVDAIEFTRAVIQGQAAASRGNPEHAIAVLQAAEEMISGEPLAGLPGEWAQAARTSLVERRHVAALTRIRLQLDHDDPRGLIPELTELAARYPLDESVAALLMRALQGAGRTGDALAVYTQTRQHLQNQLGVDPHRPLTEVHQLVLRGEPTTAPRAAEMRPAGTELSVPDTLERDPPVFIGRQNDVDHLLARIGALLEQNRPVVCVIDGMPGMGKSTLALRLAHELRGRCRHGALQLHLRGHDPLQAPTSPSAALNLLLRMLRVDLSELQRDGGLDHAISLWRRHTCTSSLVIVLDDAVDEQQVLPLLPAGTGSVVLITARHRLADLPDAVHHSLALMAGDDARALFLQAAGAAECQDSESVRQIIDACDRLPLALSVAGGFLRARPSWSIADFADHLTRALRSHGVDSFTKRLYATFETSYREMPELSQRVLRRLALHPGSAFSLHAAAALAEASLSDTDFALDLLVEHHLLAEPERHRYQMHDLVRGFASHLLSRSDAPESVAAAQDRFAQFILVSVDRATAVFHPYRHTNLLAGTRPAPVPAVDGLSFTDSRDAAAWLDQEQASLRAEAALWHAHDRAMEAATLVHLLAVYFDRRGLWREADQLHRDALATWVHLGNVAAQACALGDLATVHWRLGAFEQASVYSEAELQLRRTLADPDGQAEALVHLGRTHQSTHHREAAIQCYRESADLRAQTGDQTGKAEALYHLGVVLFDIGRHEDGIACTLEALELGRAGHDETIERNCVNNLGEFHRQRGEYEQALICYREAVALAERLGDPRNIAIAALNLGEVDILLRQPEEALGPLKTALEIFVRLDTQGSIAHTRLAQARAFGQLGLRDESDTAFSAATDIARGLADPLLSAHVKLTSAAIHEDRDEHTSTLADYRDALTYASDAHALLEQAAAHRGIGDVLQLTGETESAQVHWREALQLYSQMHARDAEALQDRLSGAGD